MNKTQKTIILTLLLSTSLISATDYIVKLDETISSSVEVVSNEPKPIIMPSWVNTNDECGGINQAYSGANIYYVSSIDNYYNSSYEIPEGFRWLTSAEYVALSNRVTYTKAYYAVCGWENYPGSGHAFMLFKDSNSKDYTGKYPVKAVNHYEGVVHHIVNGFINGGTWSGTFAGMVLSKE